MKSVVVIPGRAPHWVGDHARHLAQRLTETGRVMVVFTHGSGHHSMLPGRPGNGSVLGHSVAGYPIWTGRLAAALGMRRSSKVTILVLWAGANHGLAICAALAARLRRERLVLDVPDGRPAHQSITRRMARRVLEALAVETVEGNVVDDGSASTRMVLVLCGADTAFARLAVQTFDGMSDASADRWTLSLQIDSDLAHLVQTGGRRPGKVQLLAGEPGSPVLSAADVIVASFDGPFEDLVHHAVLTGGAGVLVGQPVAGRVARCHDGVWLAQPSSAGILVALESSSGDIFERPAPVAAMRRLANDIVSVAEREVAA